MIPITSRDNEKVKFASKLIRDRSFRYSTGMFVAEGLRICTDASQSDGAVESVFLTQAMYDRFGDQVENIISNVEDVYLVSDHVMEKISETRTTQGIASICRMSKEDFTPNNLEKSAKLLALENISDPGNMGTILRTAEALGISKVVLTGECVDVYSPKVVRSTMGSIFRISICRCKDSVEFIEKCREQNLSTWAAVVSGEAKMLSQTDMSIADVLFVGNEGNGLEQQTIDACDHQITIDMTGRSESINAAASASILIWEMCKKR